MSETDDLIAVLKRSGFKLIDAVNVAESISSLIDKQSEAIIPDPDNYDSGDSKTTLQSFIASLSERLEADEGAIRTNGSTDRILQVQIDDLKREIRTLQRNVASSDNLEISRNLQIGLSGNDCVYTLLQDTYYFAQTENTAGRKSWINLHYVNRDGRDMDQYGDFWEQELRDVVPSDMPLLVRSTRYIMPTKMDFWLTICTIDPGAVAWSNYKGKMLSDIPSLDGQGILCGGDTVTLLDAGWTSKRTAESRRIRPINVDEESWEYLLVFLSMISLLVFPFVEVGIAATLGVEVVAEGLAWFTEAKALNEAVQRQRMAAEFGQITSEGLRFNEQTMEWSYNEIHKYGTRGAQVIQGYKPVVPEDSYDVNWMDRYQYDAPHTGWITNSNEYVRGEFSDNDLSNLKAAISRGQPSEWYQYDDPLFIFSRRIRFRTVSVVRVVRTDVTNSFVQEVNGPLTSLPYSYSKVVPRNNIEDYAGNIHNNYFCVCIGSDQNPNKSRWYGYWNGMSWETDDTVFSRLE
jgi:hypothetical protein